MDKSRKQFRQLECLRPVILRSVSKNQILILSSVYSRSFYSITKILTDLSQKFGIPLSTLKLGARGLKEMELLEYERAQVRLTGLGEVVLKIVSSPNAGRDDVILNGDRNG